MSGSIFLITLIAKILCSLFIYVFAPDSSFKAVYGQDAPTLLSYAPNSSKVEAVDQELQERDQILARIYTRL